MSAIKSPLKWVGGKNRAISQLMKYVPNHVDTIAAPFIGGGSFELALAESGRRVFAYDADSRVANFWNVLLSKQNQLVSFCDNERHILKDAFNDPDREYYRWLDANHDLGTDVERAGKLWLLVKIKFNGNLRAKNGFNTKKQFSGERAIKTLMQDFPKMLTVQHQDWETTLLTHTDDFLFVDPPYLDTQDVYYRFHKEFDHIALRDHLYHRSQFILTYEDKGENSTIRELYKGFDIRNEEWLQTRKLSSGTVKEAIILPKR